MPDTYGVLIRNGVNYSHDTAESISYDNTTSELAATDVQEAIDELKSDIDSHAGGHTIIDGSGTEMNDRTGLKFVGTYPVDNSTDDQTVINVVRDMTEAQRETLSQSEQAGFINTTDNPYDMPLTTDFIMYKNNKTTTEALDEIYTLISNIYLTETVTIDTMPFTHTLTGLTADHHCIKMELGTPSVQTSDWTVTTADGSYTISGTISSGGSTTATLGFVK